MKQIVAQRLGIFIIGFLLSCTNVLAQTTALVSAPLELARSHQYHKISSLKEIPNLLKLDARCTPAAIRLIHHLTDYHHAAIRSTKPDSQWAKEAKSIYGKIKTELHDMEETNATCFDSVARAYSVAAVAMLESSFDQTLLKLASYFAYDLPGWNRDIENPRLRILSSKNRPSLGCGWTKPGQHYDYQTYGGYFCKSSTLAIDPFLPPANLGASFVHEIDHLLRDKFGRTAASWTEVRELTIYDEALSSALSAFFQLKLTLWPRQSVQNRSWLWHSELTLKELKQIPEKDGFQLDFDNNLFLKNGPVYQIVKELKKPLPPENPPDFLIPSGLLACKIKGLPERFFVREDRGVPYRSSTFFTDKMKERWTEIFTRIQRAYFTDFKPLGFESPAMPLFPSREFQRDCFRMSPTLFFYNNPELSLLVPEPSIRVFPLLESMHSFLDKVSPSCELFLRASKPTNPGVIADGVMIDLAGLGANYPGPLANYGGTCSDSSNGNEGGKTTDDRGQTGNEGGKTGNEGGKTSLGTARPCLEIP